MPREPNRMSVEEARALQQEIEMGWQEWEKKFDMLLREGGWDFWRDRVIPLADIRKKLFGLGIPPRMVHGFIKWLEGYLQRVGRKGGMPDRLIAKKIMPMSKISLELLELTGGIGTVGIGANWPTPKGEAMFLGRDTRKGAVVGSTVIGLVELKTGRATTTEAQERWLELANSCPGAFGAVGRPHETPYWRRVLRVVPSGRA